MSKKYVSYIRVSTKKQGASGLGLEAQRETINTFLNGGLWDLLKEFQEVESGKNNDRPELQKALTHCQLTGATLLVAKLDRLSRDVHFITSLEKAGVEFTVCDFPFANKFTINIFAALAQYERELISQRTTVALQAKKARGAILGKPENLTLVAAAAGRATGRAVRADNVNQFANKVKPMILSLKSEGMSQNAIAKRLNADSIRTASGKGMWTATAVRIVANR
ncbi:MAG: recombinase family protein [Desulfuromonadaceae bacterium]